MNLTDAIKPFIREAASVHPNQLVIQVTDLTKLIDLLIDETIINSDDYITEDGEEEDYDKEFQWFI
jgi:hypothetical protein